MIDLVGVMADLSRGRPVFHSEADFQHALAWQMQATRPDSRLRLEYRPMPSQPIALDIWFQQDEESLAVEVKYLTRHLTTMVDGEVFSLRNHSAQDQRRYDVIKDITRVERIVEGRRRSTGAVVVLTNDHSYWRTLFDRETADAAFRLHEGRVLEGTLYWGSRAGPATMKGREAPLDLRGQYALRWRDYSTVSVDRGLFRFLLIHVRSHDSMESEAERVQSKSHE